MKHQVDRCLKYNSNKHNYYEICTLTISMLSFTHKIIRYTFYNYHIKAVVCLINISIIEPCEKTIMYYYIYIAHDSSHSQLKLHCTHVHMINFNIQYKKNHVHFCCLAIPNSFIQFFFVTLATDSFGLCCPTNIINTSMAMPLAHCSLLFLCLFTFCEFVSGDVCLTSSLQTHLIGVSFSTIKSETLFFNLPRGIALV